MTPGVAVGWIVVFGFAATLVLTLLALIKVVSMEPKYVNRLFALLVVELIGSAFYLFDLEFRLPNPQFQPNFVTADVYLFDNTGRPLPRTDLIFGDDTLHTFNSGPIAFDLEREFEISDNALLIKGQPGDYQLGTIDIQDLSRAEDSFMSFQAHLSLGLHYAECLDGTVCQQRRDARQAITHLFAALATENETDVHERAVLQLFHLKERLQTCSTFGQLAEELERHRPVPYRYLELGEIYFAMALYLDEIDPEDRTTARWLALKNFLRFLSLPQVDVGTDLFTRANDQANQVATTLTFGRDHPVSSALQSVDRQQFALASESIDAMPLACVASS